jgi:hypothetical protein
LAALTRPASSFAHLHEADGTGQRQRGQRQHKKHHHRAGAEAGAGGELVLQVAERGTQRFAVGQDGGLRFARSDQALEVAQNGAGLRARLLVGLENGFELLARLRIARAGQALLGIALEQAARDFLEGVQVFAEQEHRVGAHAFDGKEFIGRLADALRQHHELAGGRDLGQGGVLLHLERSHGLGHFEQVGRLAIDVAQRGTHLRQDLLLGQHGLGALVGALDQRRDLAEFGVVLAAHAFQLERIVAVCQALHAPREVVRAVLDFRESGNVAHQRLRDRLGETLRLHQRLAGGRNLLRQPFGAQDGGAGDEQQQQHHGREHDREYALLARRVRAQRAHRARGPRRNRALGFGLRRFIEAAGRRLVVGGVHSENRLGRRLGHRVAPDAHRFLFGRLHGFHVVERQGRAAVDTHVDVVATGGQEFLELVGDRAHGRSFR